MTLTRLALKSAIHVRTAYSGRDRHGGRRITGMNASRSSWLAPVLVAAILLAALLASYPGAYLALGKGGASVSNGGQFTRVYETDWQVILFAPAARVETAIRGREVLLLYYLEEIHSPDGLPRSDGLGD